MNPKTLFLAICLSLFVDTFSQDTLVQINPSRNCNETFVLHEDGRFDYYLKHKHYTYYGVGRYTKNEKRLNFDFDPYLLPQSSYSCDSSASDSLEIIVTENRYNEIRTNYYYYLGGFENVQGWKGSIPINSESDSVKIWLEGYQPVTIYPKKEQCNHYSIKLALHKTMSNSIPPIPEGTIEFIYKKRKDIWVRKVSEELTALELYIRQRLRSYEYYGPKEYRLIKN